MEDGITILGTITDAFFVPLGGVELVVTSTWSEAGELRKSEQRGVCGEGEFRLDGIHAGKLVLTASAAGYEPKVLRLGTIEAGDVLSDRRLVLRGAHALVLRTRDALGRPLARACVRHAESGHVFASDEAGLLRFEYLPARALRFEAWWGPEDALLLGSAAAEAGAVSELELVLQLPGELAVRVADAPEARATLRDERGVIPGLFDVDGRDECGANPWWRFEELAEGGALWRGLEARRYWVQVEDSASRRAAWREVEVRPGERTEVELTLEPATRLAVQVRLGGARVPARLVLRSAAGWALDPELDSDVADFPTDLHSEEYALQEFLVPPGSYVLAASRAGARVTREFTLAGEPSLRLELELPSTR
jgi:hypothetical protein